MATRRAQAPAILRGIQLYHVQANGWNDIGYNFLVDRFGTVYEGRYGGVDANVIGAQAQGFNTGSVGVALLGTYGTSHRRAPRPSRRSCGCWRGGSTSATSTPASMLTVVSGGSPKFAAGVPVLLRAVSGHRDVGLTACPGDALYARLQAIGAETRRTGLAEALRAAWSQSRGASVVFRARLSTSLPWTVSVTDAQGAAVASGGGTGTATRLGLGRLRRALGRIPLDDGGGLRRSAPSPRPAGSSPPERAAAQLALTP